MRWAGTLGGRPAWKAGRQAGRPAGWAAGRQAGRRRLAPLSYCWREKPVTVISRYRIPRYRYLPLPLSPAISRYRYLPLPLSPRYLLPVISRYRYLPLPLPPLPLSPRYHSPDACDPRVARTLQYNVALQACLLFSKGSQGPTVSARSGKATS